VTVKFSTGIPNCREGRLNPIGSVDRSWLRDVAAAADGAGYYSLWLNEFLETDPNVAARFDNPPNYYDPLITIGYLAALTRKIRFVTSTIVLPHHHPVLLNRQLATLDVLSDGRITLGIGLGGSVEEYRRMRGDLGAANRGRMMDEFVEALRVLWRDDRASFSGRYVKFDDLQCYPKPTQQPLPIFMAGEADGALRRLARFGDGWIDTFFPPDAIREKITQIHSYIREARGGDVPIEIARQFYISLADSAAAAGANVKQSLPHAKATQPGRRREGMEMNLVGTPPMIASRLREYAAAGVTEICAIFYSSNAKGALRQMEVFAGEVIPAVVSGA
jgi:probable F420-dependent oxidoreductase